MSEPHAVDGGLRNPDVRHERTDVDTKAILAFVVALGVGIAVIMLALWGLFALFMNQEEAEKKSEYPLAVVEPKPLPPAPRLEGISAGEPKSGAGGNKPGAAIELIAAQEAKLNNYGWTNETKTSARIPIEEAMKRIVGKLPARQGERPPDVYLEEPSQSSSGRRTRGNEK